MRLEHTEHFRERLQSHASELESWHVRTMFDAQLFVPADCGPEIVKQTSMLSAVNQGWRRTLIISHTHTRAPWLMEAPRKRNRSPNGSGSDDLTATTCTDSARATARRRLILLATLLSRAVWPAAELALGDSGGGSLEWHSVLGFLAGPEPGSGSGCVCAFLLHLSAGQRAMGR